jgi:hypothetical protein
MNKAIVDTGSSLAYVPSGLWVKFVQTLMGTIPYQLYSDAIVSSCDRTLYKSVFLYADNKYFEITPSNYVLTVDIGIPGKCLIGFTKFSSDRWLLGDVFLRNFYSIWNEETD